MAAKVKWFTKERMSLISKDNIEKYEKYYKSCSMKNKDVEGTTFKTYKARFTQFLCWLAVEYDNIGIYSDEYFKNAIDIMEDYIYFCQNTLLNGKKTINNKIAAISTFYIWSRKRKYIDKHPFDKILDRMQNAKEEVIIKPHFLTHKQVEAIKNELETNTNKFDIQDRILFEVAIDSANRLGALEKLTLSSLDIDEMVFTDIREKRGYKVEVVFEEKAKELILQWLEMRKDKYDKLEVDSLLITNYGGEYCKMKRGTIQYRMRKIGTIVGIENFHAHSARKSSLDLTYKDTGDLLATSQLANHRSTQTTIDSYIRPQSKTELRNKINELKKKNLKHKNDEESDEIFFD